MAEETTKSIRNNNKNLDDAELDQTLTKLSAKEILHLMDRSDSVFSENAPELETDLVRVAKPITGDLNDTLAAM